MAQHLPDAQHASSQAQSPPTSQAQPAAAQRQSSQEQTTQQTQGDVVDEPAAVDDRKADKAIGETSRSASTDKEKVFMEILQNVIRK